MTKTHIDQRMNGLSGLTWMGIDHDAAFVDRLADFVLGTALVFARIGGTVEGAHNQLGTSSAG